LKKGRKKNKSLKGELLKLKESSQSSNFEEDQKMIMNLKFQVEEARRIEEILRIQLEEKRERR
jgi:hypothetical protein